MLVYSQVCAPLAQYWNLSCMKSATNYSCNVILVESNGVYWSSSARASHCRQTFSSRPFSIIRLRNVSSRMNLSWIHWKKLFLALLLQLVGRKVFPVSRLFTISMSVRSSFLGDVLRNWKKVHRILDELLIRPSSFAQEVPARAIDDAYVPVWWTYCALRFRFRLE